MKLVRDARTLKLKALSSLRIAMQAFNSYDDDGRVTAVLLHLQHAGEMLLKAVLCQNKAKVFDKDSGKSIGFERCLGLCQASHGLTDAEAGVFRAVDALRDEAQHWYVFVSEDLLYLHTRAMVTSFDAYMQRSLASDLNSHIPPRVLPVSTKPPGDFDFLVDREYKLVADLLSPGKRKRDEARARIRSLLAMEAVVHEGVEISEKDVNRIEKAVRDGKTFEEVFPRLNTIGSATTGEGPMIKVVFSKKEGAPIKYVAGDDPAGAAAVREVDLNKKFYMRASELSKRVGLSLPKSHALRQHLGIDGDPACCHVFEYGSTKIPCFSDNARTKMKEAAGCVDMKEVWQKYSAGKKKK